MLLHWSPGCKSCRTSSHVNRNRSHHPGDSKSRSRCPQVSHTGGCLQPAESQLNLLPLRPAAPAGGSDQVPTRRSVNIHPALSREESKHLPSAVTLFGQRSPLGPRRKQRGRTHTSNNVMSSSHASGVRERPHSRLAEERPPSDLHLLSAQTS